MALIVGEAAHLPDYVPHELGVLGEAPMPVAVPQLAHVLGHLVAFVEAHSHGVAQGHGYSFPMAAGAEGAAPHRTLARGAALDHAMVKNVPERQKWHSSSSSQSSEISTKSKSVGSSLGGLSRSSTVASLNTDSTESSGQSNSNLDTCAEFRIKYVSAIEKLTFSEGKSLEGHLDLINYIDVAQQDGKLPVVPLEEEFIMGVSKYGIKVSTSHQYDVPAQARSAPDHPHGVLRKWPGGREEPTGSEDHGCKQRRVQPMGLSVQQPGTSTSHLQSFIHCFGLCTNNREIVNSATVEVDFI